MGVGVAEGDGCVSVLVGRTNKVGVLEGADDVAVGANVPVAGGEVGVRVAVRVFVDVGVEVDGKGVGVVAAWPQVTGKLITRVRRTWLPGK